MHPRLADVAEYVEQQRDALLATAMPVPDAQWTRQPRGGGWSVSEVLEHLHRVEAGSARLIEKLATDARAAGHPPEREDTSVLGTLAFARLTDRAMRVESPERVRPAGGWPRAATLEALAASRQSLRAAFAAADGLALGTLRHPHVTLGDIDLYQWLLFVGQHEARHAAQVEEIVRALPPD